MEQFFGSFTGTAFEFGEARWLLAAWGVAVLFVIGMLAARMRRHAARRFADSDRLAMMLGKRRRMLGLIRGVVMVLGLLLIVGATMRPRANPHQEMTEAKGRDIVFLVDVSKSMLVRDVAPNRLERAKLWISDMVAELKTDRVGLVAFAGSSSVQSPLTTDRLFFDLALEELSPSVVDVGGTNIGDAIRKCMDMVFYDLDDSEGVANHRDIILITDGEDQESLPIDAARAAGLAGIRIIALGIGSDAGARVVDENNRPVRRNGVEVRSRLDSGTLSKIATATPGGAYLEIGTGDVDLANVYQELIARGDLAVVGSASVTRWDERYAVALAPGLVLILIEMVLSSVGLRKETVS
tara:strand:+ start:621290 stop:622348 length:1059 start_codon:yes stop_codon:yes gene_type:complete